DLIAVRVHHDQEAFVNVALAARGEELARSATEDIAERERSRIIPVLSSCLLARRSNPCDVFDARFRKHLAAQKAWTREYAVTATEMDQIPDEPSQLFVLGPDMFPVEPGGFVVLTVGVVVAALGSPDLVSSKQHRHSERQK